MRPPRMWWAGDERGWVVDVENLLSPAMLSNARSFTLRVQEDRFRLLPPGDAKDECERTITALKAGRVTQNIIGAGDHVLFDGYKSEGRRVFVP